MSTPQDSTAPAPILPSDPAYVADKTNAVRFSERVREWIAALSPSGADEYDTGWVDLPLMNGWEVASGLTLRVRRVGREVSIEGRVSGGSEGLVAELPAPMRPTQTRTQIVVSGGHSGSPSFTSVSISAAGTVSANTGTTPNIIATWFV